MCLEDFVTQQCTSAVLLDEEPAVQSWTLSSLIDAATLVYSQSWVQLHRMASETAGEAWCSGSALAPTLQFSQCMLMSLTCSLQESFGHTQGSKEYNR